MLIRNLTRGFTLGDHIQEADTFGRRLLGLMFRSRLASGEGLLIFPCQSVHTHFMRIPIDVVFVDRQWRVVHVEPAMKPWRFSRYVPEAWAAIEVAFGEAKDTAPGDQLERVSNPRT